jgi:tetratricopeptide (TPR) repeat protein
LKIQPPSRPPFPLLSPGAASPRGPSHTRAPYRGIDLIDPLHRLSPASLPRPKPAPAQVLQKTDAQIAHLYELGLTSIAMSFHEAALENIQEVTSLAPDHAGAWKTLASLFRLSGRDNEAEEADAKADGIDSTSTKWRDAVGERSASRLETLDRKLKQRLQKIPEEARIGFLRDELFANPTDVALMRYLSNEEDVADDEVTAKTLLERALSLSPNYLGARFDYAKLLVDQRDHLSALRQSDYLLAHDPHHPGFRLLRADAAVQAERQSEALAIFESLLQKDPKNTHVLNSYGSLLKTVGRREESVAAFRKVLSITPGAGSAYFGLSELKAKFLTEADVVDMRRYLAEGIANVVHRKGMAYALGATLERARDYQGSFEAYSIGAAACKEEVAGTNKSYQPPLFEERLQRIRKTFTAESMARCAAPKDAAVSDITPIFVLGMPRAGSTLVEQILASHSLVEGTRELPVVSQMTKKIAMTRVMTCNDVYPERVVEMDRAQLDLLGQECLDKMGEYRNTTRPYVIDKRPWNWLDACFIHLMLPQARFIDIRRPPMAAGFAMFKQLLPADASFSFDLQHLGHYYRNYVEFMDYQDTIMPGRILRVSYPKLIDDTETEIRRMLDYCGLPFEEGCLRFWQTDRAVLTPSAEQVRRPIFRDALDQWRNYEAWLGPLREALGDLAEA